MTKPLQKERKGYANRELEDALAALIASTRRVNRKLNLGEVVRMLKIALQELGSLSRVADSIGLSAEMLRQFSRYERLHLDVKQLVDEGKIQSVDIMDRISRLPMSDQPVVSQAVIKGILTSDDVRAIVSLRKALPKETISKIIGRVITSRNIKEYLLEFVIPKNMELSEINRRFRKLLGKERIVSFNDTNGIGTIILNAEGKNRFQEIATIKHLTKRSLLNKVISGEII